MSITWDAINLMWVAFLEYLPLEPVRGASRHCSTSTRGGLVLGPAQSQSRPGNTPPDSVHPAVGAEVISWKLAAKGTPAEERVTSKRSGVIGRRSQMGQRPPTRPVESWRSMPRGSQVLARDVNATSYYRDVLAQPVERDCGSDALGGTSYVPMRTSAQMHSLGGSVCGLGSSLLEPTRSR
jgi:hypothetical protein